MMIVEILLFMLCFLGGLAVISSAIQDFIKTRNQSLDVTDFLIFLFFIICGIFLIGFGFSIFYFID